MTPPLSLISHARLAATCTLVASLAIGAAPVNAAAPVKAADDPGHSHDHPVVETYDVEGGKKMPPGVELVDELAPDLDDLPAEWLIETPAEKVTPTDTSTLSLPTKGLSATARSAALAVPAPPQKSLPSTLDAHPGFQSTYSCDPNDKPGMVAFAKLVSSHYNRSRYGTSRSCEMGNSSQHAEGRAVDWTMNVYDPSDKAIGDSVAQWLTANNGEMARRFGIELVIWNKRVWGLYAPGEWRDYSGPSPHTDHLHFSFTWDGAMKRTSWWTGKAVTLNDQGTCRVYSNQYAPRYTGRNTTSCARNLPNPPSSKYPVTLPGARNSNVNLAQRYLGSALGGYFGPGTLAALLNYQDSNGLPWTGVLDNATWSYMDSAGVPGEQVPPDDDNAGVSRIGGQDRYEVAANVASLYPTGRDVYITTGQKYPDALAAGARAGSLGDPLLLTRSDRLPPSTITELKRIKPRKIYVVGGAVSVEPSVIEELRGYAGEWGVQRLGGADRYEMAANVSREFGTSPTVAYIATGQDYPDALAAAARAGHNDAPVLLTRQNSLPSYTRDALRELRPERIVVVGSTGAVSDQVEDQLVGYASDRRLQRVSGSGAHGTSAALSSYYPAGGDVVYLASSNAFADALAAASRGANDSAPILLTDGDSLPNATREALIDLKPDRVVILGGAQTISSAVMDEIETLID